MIDAARTYLENSSLQGLEDIIRDTGPVDSNLTSANASKYNSEVGHCYCQYDHNDNEYNVDDDDDVCQDEIKVKSYVDMDDLDIDGGDDVDVDASG